MKLLACIFVLGISDYDGKESGDQMKCIPKGLQPLRINAKVNIQCLNPRSVNVALETVLEFDGKHNYRDLKAIDKLQDYLHRMKNILTEKDNSRRHLREELKFRNFLKISLETIKSYDDSDLLDVIVIANKEIRKYHYKGCKFYELVENQELRKAIIDKIEYINDLTTKQLRAEMTDAANSISNDLMPGKKKKFFDYLDSIYVVNEIKEKMEEFLRALEQFKKRSKRGSLNLGKVIKDGFRSIIFDHYSNLNPIARKELKSRLESFWQDLKRAKEDTWKIMATSTTTAKNMSTTATENLGKLYRINILRSKPKRKKSKKENRTRFKSIVVTDVIKHKKTTIPDSKEEVTKSKKKKKGSIKPIEIEKSNDKFKEQKKVKHHKSKTTTPKPVSSSNEIQSDKLSDVRDSIEVHKEREVKKSKRKQKQKDEDTEELKVYFKKHTTNQDNVETDEDSENHEFTKSMRKTNLNDNLSVIIEGEEENITISTTVTPCISNKIDRIEKVLDEIKNIVSVKETRKAIDKNGKNTVLQKKITRNGVKQEESISSNFTKSTLHQIIAKDKVNDINNANLIKDSPEVSIASSIATEDKSTTETPKFEETKNNALDFKQLESNITNHKDSFERIKNETRTAGLEKVFDRNAEEHQEMNEKINEKIEGHMRNLFSLTGKDHADTPLDLNFNDPFKEIEGTFPQRDDVLF